MRNIAQYPVTLEECIKAVERAYEEEIDKAKSPDYPIGGIHIAALKDSANRLRRLLFAAQ